jgi:chaperone modulatory protein CbpM
VTRIDYTEVHWIDEQPACSLQQLAEASRISEPELRELVELGALHPTSPPAGAAGDAHQPWFAARCLVTLQSVRRLREDFDLDTQALSVALALLERIEALEHEVRSLRARLPGGPP